jgi:hypothetical protein
MKFKVPGNEKLSVRIGSSMLTGGTVIDNDIHNFPLNQIPKIWILDEEEAETQVADDKPVEGTPEEKKEEVADDKPVDSVEEKSAEGREDDSKEKEEPKEFVTPDPDSPTGIKEEPVPEEPKDETGPETAESTEDALKKHLKDTFTVAELKVKAKELGIAGYYKMNEETLVGNLVEKGFKG